MSRSNCWRAITAFGCEEVLLEFYKPGRPSIWVQAKPGTQFGDIVLKYIAIACQRPMATTGDDFLGARAEYMPVPGQIMIPEQVLTQLLMLPPDWHIFARNGQECLWRKLVHLEALPEIMSLEERIDLLKHERPLVEYRDGEFILYDEGGRKYCFESNRIDTNTKLLDWVSHLSEKVWVTGLHIRKVLELAEQHLPGIQIHGG